MAAAYTLDALAGDPPEYPHPVRFMGKLTEFLERRARRSCDSQHEETYAGLGLALIVAGGTYIIARLLLMLPGKNLTETLLLYTSLARKDLARSSLQVADALEKGDVGEARQLLRSLVGRDVDCLDAHAIARATVESVAENFVDGVFSPLLWAAAGGAPAALAFKAISTLDSMVGHRDEQYLNLGRFSARMDDVANFPAARLSIPLIAMASFFSGYDARMAFRMGTRDRLKHDSPNSAHPEAVFAGALGLKLGGPSRYGGGWRNLPEIGEGTLKAGPRHIRNAVRLLNTASFLGLLLAMIWSRRKR